MRQPLRIVANPPPLRRLVHHMSRQRGLPPVTESRSGRNMRAAPGRARSGKARPASLQPPARFPPRRRAPWRAGARRRSHPPAFQEAKAPRGAAARGGRHRDVHARGQDDNNGTRTSRRPVRPAGLAAGQTANVTGHPHSPLSHRCCSHETDARAILHTNASPDAAIRRLPSAAQRHRAAAAAVPRGGPRHPPEGGCLLQALRRSDASEGPRRELKEAERHPERRPSAPVRGTLPSCPAAGRSTLPEGSGPPRRLTSLTRSHVQLPRVQRDDPTRSG